MTWWQSLLISALSFWVSKSTLFWVSRFTSEIIIQHRFYYLHVSRNYMMLHNMISYVLAPTSTSVLLHNTVFGHAIKKIIALFLRYRRILWMIYLKHYTGVIARTTPYNHCLRLFPHRDWHGENKNTLSVFTKGVRTADLLLQIRLSAADRIYLVH